MTSKQRAGIVGSLFALSIGLSGLNAILIDKQSSDRLNSDSYDGRSYAINLGSKKLLVALKLWSEIKDQVQIVSKISLQQGMNALRPQPFELEFFDYEIHESPIFYMIEDRFLRKAILKHVTGCSKILHLTSKSVISHEIIDGVTEITLNDMQKIRASLAIGADGFPSKFAKRSKIKNLLRDYCQSSIVGVVRHEKQHNDEAVQIFLSSGPLAILPLQGDRSCYVWTMERNEANRIYNLKNESFVEKLRSVFGDRRGSLRLDTPKSIFPIGLGLPEKLVDEKFALIGDSAHQIHPIAGQGLNLGIRDIASLAEVLVLARRHGEDIGSLTVLSRYAKWRTFDILSMSLLTDLVNKVFSTDNFLLQIGRGFSFKFIGDSPALKRYLIKEASGLLGDSPKLLQGRNI